MSTVDTTEEYRRALKLGQKEYKHCLSVGEEPHLQVLDDILDNQKGLQQVSVGLVEIPMELIVGTRTAGRQFSFSRSFLPLLSPDTEFALKWCKLCEAHMGDEGIREPVRCLEYYGKFYVQEGNKRVSVLRYYDATAISGYVTRILPANDGSAEYALYQEFLEFYRLAPIYSLQFSQPGSYRKLLAKLGMTGKQWEPDQIQRFRSSFMRFRSCLRGQLYLDALTPADVLLIFLRYHSYADLRDMTTDDLKQAIAALQPDVTALSQPDPVAVSTEPADPAKENLIDKLLPRRPKRLKIAFVHEMSLEKSTWVQGHEQGRRHLEEILPNQVETRAYFEAVAGSRAEEVLEQAVADGADVIFTTSPPLMDATLRAKARHPEVWMLNCSVDMPYAGIRTYYARVYEGKFITGAIAGALARNGRIGYIGSYPIYGVPASINAFALGAQMVNPGVEIHLEWSCVKPDCFAVFRDRGIYVASNRDIPMPGQQYGGYGICILEPDGSATTMASPVWYWGRLYERIVRSILDGSWDAAQAGAGKRSVNYWWGMSSGAIDVQLSDALPEGVPMLAQILRRELQSGQLDPFARRIVSQDGTVRNDGSCVLSPGEILRMDWLCDCVRGHIPTYDEVLPMARRMIRLQGVYRDQIPPEEEA